MGALEDVVGTVGEHHVKAYSASDQAAADQREEILNLLVGGPWVLILPSIYKEGDKDMLKVMTESNAPVENPEFIGAILEAALKGYQAKVRD
jgi:hypothetical protein